MKKQYIIMIFVLFIGIVGGMFFRPCTPKMAFVNVSQIVKAYPKLSLVQRENALKIGELSQWLDAAQKKIDAEKNKTKKANLVKKVQAEALQKKAAIQQEYNQKTVELDNEITSIVSQVAKQNGCHIVFAKTSVVSGGIDITEKVLEKFKESK